MTAVFIVTVIPALLALIYIGSSSVFEDVVSLATSGLYASYLIPCSSLLWRRLSGHIKPYSEHSDDEVDAVLNSQADTTAGLGFESNDVVQPSLRWGPWRIPQALGIINNVYACVYILFVLFWNFWPPSTPTTVQSMNYSILMTGSAIIFAVVYYYVWGKTQYIGPLVEFEVKDIARKIDRTMEE